MSELEKLQTEREVLLLKREQRTIDRLKEQDKRAVVEDAWASSDPYTSRQRPGIQTTSNDLFQHAFGFHTARPGSRRHGSYPPFYRTEMEHWQIVDAARTLEGLCSTAAEVLDVLTQFAIFTGFTYKVIEKNPERPEPGVDARPMGRENDIQQADGGEARRKRPPTIVEKAQEVLDKFIKINRWYEWEREIFRRSRRDGEAFVYLEPDPVSGLFLLRSVEPEQVKSPQDAGAIKRQLGADSSMSWWYGILTPKDDTSRAEGYWVVSQYNDAQNLGEFIPAEEMLHVKTEWVDRCAKRGVSDFFSVANDMHGTRKLLRNLRESATVQAAIAWIREHPIDMDVGRAGGVTAASNVNQSGEVVPATRYDGPVMLDVSQGMEYKGGPIGDGQSDLIQVLQAALRSVGARWQMPEALISGDASNANLASALVAEAPFVRALQTRQWHYKLTYEALMERVLEYAASTGQLGAARDTILDQVAISVEMPPVVPRKLKEETDRNETLHKNEILSRQTWSAREDLDPDEENQLMDEDPPRLPQNGMDNGDQEGKGETADVPEGERV